MNEKIVEAVARAIADVDGEDYMEDCRRFDKWARAAITAFQAEAWQPIETAPKGASHVLLFGAQAGQASDVHWEGSFVTSGYWDGIDQAWCATGSNWTGPFLEPTHWQPLPPSPSPDRSET